MALGKPGSLIVLTSTEAVKKNGENQVMCPFFQFSKSVTKKR